MNYHVLAIERYHYLLTDDGRTWAEFNKKSNHDKENMEYLVFAGPWLVAYYYKIFGPGFEKIVWINYIFLLTALIGIIAVCKRIYNYSVGLVAGSLFLASIITIGYVSFFSKEIFVMPIFVWLVYALSKKNAWKSYSNALFVSFLVPAGMAFRFDFAAIAAPAILLSIWSEVRNNQNKKTFPKPILVPLVIGYLLLSGLYKAGVIGDILDNIKWLLPLNIDVVEYVASGDSKGRAPAALTELFMFLMLFWTPLMAPIIVKRIFSLDNHKGIIFAALIGVCIPNFMKTDYNIPYAFLSLPFLSILIASGISFFSIRVISYLKILMLIIGILGVILPLSIGIMARLDPEEPGISKAVRHKGGIKDALIRIYRINLSTNMDNEIFEAVKKLKRDVPYSGCYRICIDSEEQREEMGEMIFYYNRMTFPRDTRMTIFDRKDEQCQVYFADEKAKRKLENDGKIEKSLENETNIHDMFFKNEKYMMIYP